MHGCSVVAKERDFRFHDPRHGVAPYLPLNRASLAEVLGDKSVQMTKCYAHVSNPHPTKFVAKMNEKRFATC